MSALKRRAGFAFTPVLMGMIGLFSLTRPLRFAAIHTVDILRSIATGLCFGVALAILLSGARERRESAN